MNTFITMFKIWSCSDALHTATIQKTSMASPKMRCRPMGGDVNTGKGTTLALIPSKREGFLSNNQIVAQVRGPRPGRRHKKKEQTGVVKEGVVKEGGASSATDEPLWVSLPDSNKYDGFNMSPGVVLFSLIFIDKIQGFTKARQQQERYFV